jgi:hypothetical protein
MREYPKIYGAAVGACLVAAVAACGSPPAQPNGPSPGPTSSAPADSSPSPAPAPQDSFDPGGIGAGKPGAFCATSRLGKTFVKDGTTYECKGPKPYRWRKA